MRYREEQWSLETLPFNVAISGEVQESQDEAPEPDIKKRRLEGKTPAAQTGFTVNRLVVKI